MAAVIIDISDTQSQAFELYRVQYNITIIIPISHHALHRCIIPHNLTEHLLL